VACPRRPDPFHDPRQDAIFHSPPARMALVPAHKSLLNQPAHLGLPIGNLSSQSSPTST